MKLLDYIRGKRRGKDAHSLEYDAMSDPFLADAMEGYDSVPGNHADKIAQMQTRISARMQYQKRSSGAWKLAIAACVLIAFLGGYFALMNHKSTMLVAQHQDNSYINLYIPQDYVDSKRLELTEQRENNPSEKVEAVAFVDIENLHEVIMPVERMTIYIPEAYAQLKKKELEELSLSKERENREEEFQESIEVEEEQIAPSPPSVELAMAPEPLAKKMREEQPVEDIDKDVVSLIGDIVAGINIKESITLSGKVVDTNNEPIIGAPVAVKGTEKGTITDIDGNYKLQVDSENVDLIANYIGYETIEIPKAKTNEVIAMKEDTRTLDEVVVTGYGTQKRSSVTGSVATVKSKNEIVPEPLIGNKEYKKYLENNLVRPDDTDCEKTSGKVVLEFSINSGGRPVNISVKKSLCDSYDKEAIRLVEEGPDWTLGTARVKVEVKF
ncbi:MAG: carboxypeptidase-like regulatory domain-containing protein [Dysgonomonas sp.]|nr:carboxypeptidase-like regulatory domain-containing protein [Dysgonomonas sp.]